LDIKHLIIRSQAKSHRQFVVISMLALQGVTRKLT